MSRGPLVLVMEAAQNRPALHSAKSRPPLWWPPLRRVERERAVLSQPVVVTDVFMEHAPQVARVEDDDVVEALTAQRSDHPLRDGVRVGGSVKSQTTGPCRPAI